MGRRRQDHSGTCWSGLCTADLSAFSLAPGRRATMPTVHGDMRAELSAYDTAVGGRPRLGAVCDGRASLTRARAGAPSPPSVRAGDPGGGRRQCVPRSGQLCPLSSLSRPPLCTSALPRSSSPPSSPLAAARVTQSPSSHVLGPWAVSSALNVPAGPFLPSQPAPESPRPLS